MTHLTLGHYDSPDRLFVASVAAGLAIVLLAFPLFANAFGQRPDAARLTVDFSMPAMRNVNWTAQPAPRAWLGADLADSDRGVIVLRTSPDGPADEAGIRSGDVLLSIDDTRVAAVSDVLALIEAAVPENPLRMRIRRDGKELTCSVILRERLLTQAVRRGIVQ